MRSVWQCEICCDVYWDAQDAQRCELGHPAPVAADRDLPASGSQPGWVIDIPIVCRSQNTLYGKHGHIRAHRRDYAKVRDVAQTALMALRIEHAIPRAEGKRRITWTRVLGPREKLFDTGNLIGGLKPVVDAAVLQGLLVDDTPALYEGEYLQADGDRSAGPLLRARIEEVTPC